MRQAIAFALVSLPTVLVVLALFAVLLSVVRRVRKTGFFDARVVRRLRLIGVVVIVGGVAASLIELLAQLELSSTVTARSVSATSPWRACSAG